MFKMLFNSFFFLILEREARVYFWRDEAEVLPISPVILPTLHSSFILPGSSAYIPCAVRGVQESFVQTPL